MKHPNVYLQAKTTRDAMLWGFLLDLGVISSQCICLKSSTTCHPMLSLHTRGLIKRRVSEYTLHQLTSPHPEQNHTVSQIPESTQIQLGFKNLRLQVLKCKCPMLITLNMNRTFYALDLQRLFLNSKAELSKIKKIEIEGLNLFVHKV